MKTDIFKDSPIKHFKIQEPEISELDNIYSIQSKIYVDMINRHEAAIYEAIVKEAKEAGINDLYLLDKEFIISAIREKIEREME